jgi:lipopolysaccharide transport system ATP-binding protein
MSSSALALSLRAVGKKYVIRHGVEHADTLVAALLKRSLRRPGRSERKETFWALKDVTFDVQKGDVVGLIGRNGAGKSTLLKVASRITTLTEGELRIDGRVGSLLEVGTGFHSELTGRENIFLNGAILGMGRNDIRRQLDAIVEFAEVTQFLDTPVKRYSSGMYMRLAFAVAAHLEPEILIVDEVLAVGDMQFQRKCLGKMGEVAKAGKTVLFVSHNMAAIRQLCNRGILLSKGRVAFDGGIADCVEAYAGSVRTGGATIGAHLSGESGPLRITRVLVNGAESDEIYLPSEARHLDIEVEGVAERGVTADIQITLRDENDNALGWYSPAHDRGAAQVFGPGEVRIRRRMGLPRIFRGTYRLSLEVSDPGAVTYARLDGALVIHAEGVPVSSLVPLEQHTFAGWMRLEDKPLGVDE